MAAPSFVSASTGATDAGGAWSFPVAGSPGGAGNILVVQILQDGATAGAITGVNWPSTVRVEALDGTDSSMDYLGAFAVGGSSEALQHLWIGRTISTSAGFPTIAGSNSTSEDLYFRLYEFTNVSTGTTLATVIENSTAGSTANEVGTSATTADAGVTTLGPDRLALNFVAVNDDNVIPAFTGETGGDWTLAVSPYAESSGTDGAIGLQQSYVTLVGNQTGIGQQEFGITGIDPRDRIAQSFPSGAGGTITSLYLKVDKAGTPTDNLIAEIQTDSGGVPSGTVVGTGGSIAGTSLTTTDYWQTFVVNATLSASTTYWVVLRRSGASEEFNYYNTGSSDANPYSGGAAYEYVSGSWSAIANTDLLFGLGVSAGGTINGGSGSITDSDAWGVVGFALIGTTVVDTTYYPRHPAHDFGSVTNF